MQGLINLLEEIEKYLEKQNANIFKRLQPGLNPSYTEQLLKGIGVYNNDELLELYGWKNGIQYESNWVIGEVDFFSSGLIVSAEDMIKTYKLFNEKDFMKDETLLPIFTDGSGDYVLYKTNKHNQPGQLFLYAPSLLLSAEPESIYDSLTSLFKTVIECYYRKAYTFNNGELEIDYDLEWEIAEKHNPLSNYWKSKYRF